MTQRGSGRSSGLCVDMGQTKPPEHPTRSPSLPIRERPGDTGTGLGANRYAQSGCSAASSIARLTARALLTDSSYS